MCAIIPVHLPGSAELNSSPKREAMYFSRLFDKFCYRWFLLPCYKCFTTPEKKDKIANQKRRLKAMALRAAISRGKFHLYEENSSTDWPTIDRQVTEQTIYYLQPPAKPPTRQTFCVISLSWALAKISNKLKDLFAVFI